MTRARKRSARAGRRRAALLAALLAVLAPVAASAQPAGAPSAGEALRFRYADGHAEEVSVRVWDDVTYLASRDAARLVAARESWRPELLQVTFRVGGQDVTLIPANPVAMVAEKAVLLSGPVRVWDGSFWVPLDLVTDDLVRLSGGRVVWSAARREFLIGRAANIRGVVASRRPGGAALDVVLSKLLPCELDREGRRVVVLTLRGGVLPPDSLATRGKEAALIESMQSEYVAGGVALRFALTEDVRDARADFTKDPSGIRVTLSMSAAADTLSGSAVEMGEGPDQNGQTPAIMTEPPPLPTVVIDPGHGGVDEGGLGSSGLREKDVTLGVALALRMRIEQRLGLRVVLTRETDEDVPLARRAEIANAAAADIFLSLHCDSWSDRDVQGVAAYYLWATSAEEITVALRGGAGGVTGLLAREPRFVRWDEAQTAVIDRSIRLASLVAATLSRELETPSRGLAEGPFRVLTGATMPAVVVEMGFLSNSEDEKLLGSPPYRDRVADALFQGVEAFFEEKGVGAAHAGAPGGSLPPDTTLAPAGSARSSILGVPVLQGAPVRSR